MDDKCPRSTRLVTTKVVNDPASEPANGDTTAGSFSSLLGIGQIGYTPSIRPSKDDLQQPQTSGAALEVHGS